MCGIAGYSLSGSTSVERTLAAQSLLAGIAERGADAVGYAHRCPDGPVEIHKQRSGASALLDQVVLPASATEVLVHVRDYTKGHPRIEANNHPIRHGAVVGVHNGIIFNDDDLMEQHGFERAEPLMTVDSEAIFALAEAAEGAASALEQLRGSMATAWIDERRPGTAFLARGVGRPRRSSRRLQPIARGSGTETSTTRPGAPGTCGRSATRSSASRPRGARRPSRRTSAGASASAPARRPARAPAPASPPPPARRS